MSLPNILNQNQEDTLYIAEHNGYIRIVKPNGTPLPGGKLLSPRGELRANVDPHLAEKSRVKLDTNNGVCWDKEQAIATLHYMVRNKTH